MIAKAHVIFLLVLLWGLPAAAQEQPVESAAAAQEQPGEGAAAPAPSDFSSLRDPFKPVIALPEAMETPVARPPQDTIMNSGPVVDPGPKMMPDPQSEQRAAAPAPVAPPAQPPTVKLQGIIWGTDRPQAIIEDQVVGVGDRIKGMKIKSIKRGQVDVIFGGEKFHVKMD